MIQQQLNIIRRSEDTLSHHSYSHMTGTMMHNPITHMTGRQHIMHNPITHMTGTMMLSPCCWFMSSLVISAMAASGVIPSSCSFLST